VPYSLFRGHGGGLVLGGSTKDMVKQYFFQCFRVSIVGGVGRFVPIFMVVERGDATGAWSSSNNSVLQLILRLH
jgi:hypothetical protein